MLSAPTIADVTIAATKGSTLIEVCMISLAWYKASARMIGADIRKVNFAALSRLIPEKRPAVMVIPERETPGIMARTCDSPTARLFFDIYIFKPGFILSNTVSGI